jgi:hypothetical protein
MRVATYRENQKGADGNMSFYMMTILIFWQTVPAGTDPAVVMADVALWAVTLVFGLFGVATVGQMAHHGMAAWRGEHTGPIQGLGWTVLCFAIAAASGTLAVKFL